MYEINILKSFLEKDNYQKYRNYLTDKTILKELNPILKGIDQWYTENVKNPTVADITNMVFATGVKDSDREYIDGVLDLMQRMDGTESVVPLLERIRINYLCNQIALSCVRVVDGEIPVSKVQELVEQLEDKVEDVSDPFVTDDLNEIIDDIITTPGLRWRLDSLNKSLGSLRKGDFGFVFARPETGKTTFLASEVTFMASQLTSDSSGPILWFNNEEQGKKVKFRCYQAALGATKEWILKNRDQAIERYAKLTKGHIKLHDGASPNKRDIAFINKREIERLCKELNPSLIIFDQIDKIKGFTNDREDLRLGQIYIWARELAKSFCPVIGVCQAGGTGENVQWLQMDHVANAHTAKQAEADFILGIGRTHQAGYEFVRYINISKNKLTGDEDTESARRHAKIETILRPEIARYLDQGDM